MSIHQVRAILAVVLGIATVVLMVKGLALIALLLLPVTAWAVAPSIVEAFAAVHRHITRDSKKEWNGRYYEYGGRHLRSVDLDDGLAFVEADILAAVEQPGARTVSLFGAAERRIDPDSGEALLTRAGCERFLVKCPHRDAKKLLHWLQRECFAPHDRAHGRDPQRAR